MKTFEVGIDFSDGEVIDREKVRQFIERVKRCRENRRPVPIEDRLNRLREIRKIVEACERRSLQASDR